MSPTRYRINPRLSDILGPLQGTRVGQLLTDRLRKYKSALILSKAAKSCRDDPIALWKHLSDHLIPDTDGIDRPATVLALLHFGSPERERSDVESFVEALGKLGWRHSDGSPLDDWDVHPSLNGTWAGIGAVGDAPTTGGFDRHPTPAAISLIHDTLLTKRAPDDPGLSAFGINLRRSDL